MEKITNENGHILLPFYEVKRAVFPGNNENPIETAYVKHPETGEEVQVVDNTRCFTEPRQWADAGFEWVDTHGWLYNWT